jgi:hypothetical protein
MGGAWGLGISEGILVNCPFFGQDSRNTVKVIVPPYPGKKPLSPNVPLSTSLKLSVILFVIHEKTWGVSETNSRKLTGTVL